MILYNDWGKLCNRGYIHRRHPSYGVSFARIWMKIDRVIATPRCSNCDVKLLTSVENTLFDGCIRDMNVTLVYVMCHKRHHWVRMVGTDGPVPISLPGNLQLTCWPILGHAMHISIGTSQFIQYGVYIWRVTCITDIVNRFLSSLQ